jgi:hypothetical protein
MKRRDVIKGVIAACMVYPPLQQVVENNNVFDEVDMFSVFFEEVNGFPINTSQREMYKQIAHNNGNQYFRLHRQRGVSTLLRTIARYDTQRGKNVGMIHCSHALAKYTKNELITSGPGRIDHFVVGVPDALRGKSYNTILYDGGFQPDAPFYDTETLTNLYLTVAFTKGKLVAVSQDDKEL